jgi:hypothetical protein
MSPDLLNLSLSLFGECPPPFSAFFLLTDIPDVIANIFDGKR